MSVKDSNPLTIRRIVDLSGLSQAAFAEKYNIPLRTLESWIGGKRTPPEYTTELLLRAVKEDK